MGGELLTLERAFDGFSRDIPCAGCLLVDESTGLVLEGERPIFESPALGSLMSIVRFATFVRQPGSLRSLLRWARLSAPGAERSVAKRIAESDMTMRTTGIMAVLLGKRGRLDGSPEVYMAGPLHVFQGLSVPLNRGAANARPFGLFVLRGER